MNCNNNFSNSIKIKLAKRLQFIIYIHPDLIKIIMDKLQLKYII